MAKIKLLKCNSYNYSTSIVSDSVNRGTSTARRTHASLYDWIVYKRGSKARERKEKNSSAARYFMRSSSHVTRVYHNPRLPRSTVFHQRRNIDCAVPYEAPRELIRFCYLCLMSTNCLSKNHLSTNCRLHTASASTPATAPQPAPAPAPTRSIPGILFKYWWLATSWYTNANRANQAGTAALNS